MTTQTRALRNRRAATWRGIASVYARVERKTTKESRTLTVQHRGWSCDNDDADGDVRSASRKDACEFQSRVVYTVRPRVAASKETAQRSESNKRRIVRARTATTTQTTKKQGRYLRCSLLLHLNIQRSSRSGERALDEKSWGERTKNVSEVASAQIKKKRNGAPEFPPRPRKTAMRGG